MALSLVTSADERWGLVAARWNSSVHLYDLSRVERREFTLPLVLEHSPRWEMDRWHHVHSAAFTPDSRFAVLVARTALQARYLAFFAVETGDRTLLRFFTPPLHYPTAIAFSPDGTTMAVGQADGTVHLYDWRRLLGLTAEPPRRPSANS
jgi:WD40 repeat protein